MTIETERIRAQMLLGVAKEFCGAMGTTGRGQTWPDKSAKKYVAKKARRLETALESGDAGRIFEANENLSNALG